MDQYGNHAGWEIYVADLMRDFRIVAIRKELEIPRIYYRNSHCSVTALVATLKP